MKAQAIAQAFGERVYGLVLISGGSIVRNDLQAVAARWSQYVRMHAMGLSSALPDRALVRSAGPRDFEDLVPVMRTAEVIDRGYGHKVGSRTEIVGQIGYPDVR